MTKTPTTSSPATASSPASAPSTIHACACRDRRRAAPAGPYHLCRGCHGYRAIGPANDKLAHEEALEALADALGEADALEHELEQEAAFCEALIETARKQANKAVEVARRQAKQAADTTAAFTREATDGLERLIAEGATLLSLAELANRACSAIATAKREQRYPAQLQLPGKAADAALQELQDARGVLRDAATVHSRFAQRLLVLLKQARGATTMSISEFQRHIL